MIRIKREQRVRREQEENERIAALRAEGTPEALARAAKIEENRKLHVDNICRVVDEKTLMNKAAPVNKPVAATEEEQEDQLGQYIETNDEVICEYAEIENLKEAEKFLLEHPVILNEHACSVLLLKQLDLEMNGFRAEMLHVVRQYLILRNILDLGKEARRTEEFRPFVQVFFKTVENDPSKQVALERETHVFAQNIILRAQQKKLEEEQELQQQQETNI
jgi:hypothetical protein